jgi:hypothetical protein
MLVSNQQRPEGATMAIYAEHADLNKAGIVRLDEVGAYAVIVNRELLVKGVAKKYAVANTEENWVESVHYDLRDALSTSLQLYAT